MSEHTSGSLQRANVGVDAHSTSQSELAALDLSDLARAIEMVGSSEIGAEPLCVLLRNELDHVKEQVDSLVLRLNQSALELRQLRESMPEALLRNEEEQRELQERNNRFVAKLLEEHAAVLETVRRERDAAIQRVRELSRELTNSGVNRRTSISIPPNAPNALPDDQASSQQSIPSNHGGERQEAEEVTRATPQFDATDLSGTSSDGR